MEKILLKTDKFYLAGALYAKIYKNLIMDAETRTLDYSFAETK